jgi:hypothetical protein
MVDMKIIKQFFLSKQLDFHLHAMIDVDGPEW